MKIVKVITPLTVFTIWSLIKSIYYFVVLDLDKAELGGLLPSIYAGYVIIGLVLHFVTVFLLKKNVLIWIAQLILVSLFFLSAWF